MSDRRFRTNPDAIATWANAITVARLLLSPLVFVLIQGDEGSWVVFVLWTLLSASDFIDGYLARRHGTTRSGAFLDPLADKVLVLGGLFALVAQDVFWWFPVVVIALREVVISLYRTVVGTRGISVPATRGAKLKTVTQQLAVGLAVLPPVARHVPWIAVVVLWVAVVLTVVTGVQYLLAARRVVDRRVRPA